MKIAKLAMGALLAVVALAKRLRVVVRLAIGGPRKTRQRQYDADRPNEWHHLSAAQCSLVISGASSAVLDSETD
jgi:hypothetical protein